MSLFRDSSILLVRFAVLQSLHPKFPEMHVLLMHFECYAVSQISTRLITFFLNLLTARLLTIDAYGVRLYLRPQLQGYYLDDRLKLTSMHDVSPSCCSWLLFSSTSSTPSSSS